MSFFSISKYTFGVDMNGSKVNKFELLLLFNINRIYSKSTSLHYRSTLIMSIAYVCYFLIHSPLCLF